MVKPFATSELLARTRAVLRRAGVSAGTVQVDELLVDPGAARVTRGGVEIELRDRAAAARVPRREP